MKTGLPAYFALERYGITPEDVVQGTLRCAPEAIRPRVVVTPHWPAALFAGAAGVTEIAADRVYELALPAGPVTLVRSGIGAPQTGDVILALGATPCETVVFTGSVGGLGAAVEIGDLIVVDGAYCGDGFTRYLDPGPMPTDVYLQWMAADAAVTRHLAAHAQAGAGATVPVHQGGVVATDSIVAQFFRLDTFAALPGCLGIEMETAALFRAAQVVGLRAGALLQVSDLPRRRRSLFGGRATEVMERRARWRTTVLLPTLLQALVTFDDAR